MFEVLDSKLKEKREWVNCKTIFFINPYTYNLLEEQPDLLGCCDCVYFDGWMIPFLYRLSGRGIYDRVSFDNTSLAPVVFDYCSRNKSRVAVVGSDYESVKKFVEHLGVEYPGLNVVLARNGYFDSDDELRECYSALIEEGVEYLICGMGAGNQERFINNARGYGYDGVAFTCGGFIHQTASSGKQYYPAWINALGLRFLYRMYDEPKLIKRYFVDYSRFLKNYFLK